MRGWNYFFSTIKKLTQVFLFFVLIGIHSSFPQHAFAQSPDTTAELQLEWNLEHAEKKVWEMTKNALVSSVGTMLMNLLVYSANQVAYTSAVWVASGGPGDDPLFVKEDITDYFEYAGAAIVMEMISTLEEQWGGIGSDPAIMAALKQGLINSQIGGVMYPTDDFNFQEIKKNYDAFLASINANQDMSSKEKSQAVLMALSRSFDSNDISDSMQAFGQTLVGSQIESMIQTNELIANSKFLNDTDHLTGDTVTPASYINQQLLSSIQRVQDLPFQLGNSAASSDPNFLSQLGISMASVFTNTLISELMNKYYAGMFKGIDDLGNPFDPDSQASSSREKAQEYYKSISTFRPISVTDYSLLEELSTCPATSLSSIRSLYSCAMDSAFASAVNRADSGDALTIQEAIDDGYLNGNWALIKTSDVARNQDENCYSYGFCYSNLVKLRKARIISIGWELAAESDQNGISNPVTLQEVIDGFYDCNDEGSTDFDHPWCHLIDPDWILKAPETTCRTYAFGQLLTSSGTSSRAEECVDIQTCISESDNGTCNGGYGYCVREENTWKFGGESCNAQFASCLSFTNRQGEAVHYLTSTVDRSSCNADSVGCAWYSTEKRLLADGTYDFPVINNTAILEASTETSASRLYLTAEAEMCDATSAGCSELLERTSDLSFNMISNPGFENDVNDDGAPDAWVPSNWSGFTYREDGTEMRTGTSAISTSASNMVQYGLALNQSRFYSFSFYAKRGSAGAATITGSLNLTQEFGEERVDLTGTSATGDCTFADYDGDGNYDSLVMQVTPSPTSYEAFECIFTSPTFNNKAARVNAQLVISAGTGWVDDVQLEQSETPSSYHVAYSGSTTSTYVTLPPDYLGCTGAEDDPAACANYTTMCGASDDGCRLYTPANGDPSISAITSALDSCPAECVGYDTYKQEGTRYEPNGDFPLYFIPSTADECSANAVGCDEFTNISNEDQEYFTYLRACLTEAQAAVNVGDAGATFYTWEGSDEEGYQLRTWSLLESNLDSAPYARMTYGASTEMHPGAAPCTNWNSTTSGTTCNDDSNGDLAVDAYTATCDEHDDIFSNPDCREFYDANGGIHYREWNETVTVSNSCATYRKTEIAGLGNDVDANGTDDGEENCTVAGGFFDSAISTCKFYGLNEESTTCSEKENGCRLYTGGQSNNSRKVFEELFESGDLTNWDAGSAASVTLSNESIATDGHSIASVGNTIWTHFYNYGSPCTSAAGCLSTGATLGGSCTVSENNQYCGTLENNLYSGKTYSLSFWAKGTGKLNVGFDLQASGTPSIDVSFGDTIELSTLWQRYTFGPIDVNEADYPTFGDGTVLVVKPTTAGTFYVDNLVLREGEEDLTLIADSWVTPASCDRNFEGTSSPQFHLGCAEYESSDGETVTLRSFSRLCSENKVGCTGFFATQQSEATNAQMVNATCSNVVTDSAGNPAIVSTPTTCYLVGSSGTAGTYETKSTALCTIVAGEHSCLFDLDFMISQADLDSDARYAHLSYGPETVAIPGDTDVYAIPSSANSCSSKDAGCTELGKPAFSSDRSVVTSWESAYLVNDPDRYDSILCSGKEVMCEEFDAGSNGLYYFKDPGASVCEYRTDVYIGSTSYSGWFRTGTNDFCYGTGGCSDTGSSCSTDSACRVSSGNCSVTGALCTQDADCRSSESCEGTSTATCMKNVGTYLVNGTYSGVWLNGDSAYDGMVATCTSAEDGCTEYRDPLAIDDDEFYTTVPGTSYYFIDNQLLADDDLLGDTKCNGEVSQKEGCALFYDTGDPSKDYNTSATYIASMHADTLFGQEQYSLVDPIDCDGGDSTIDAVNGTKVDLCTKRCVYSDALLYSASGMTLSTGYTYGNSCLVDSDCTPYESQTGNMVHGSCETSFINISGIPVTVTRLENDTNTVLQVDRDRTCAEWLTCASSRTVWDESTNEYQTICDAIDLCTEYSDSGDASFCSEWNPDDPAVILDEERYVGRDVSWYGKEFAGFAIPGIYPAQALDQVDISPESVCGSEDGSYLSTKACSTDSDCSSFRTGLADTCISNTNPEYRLGISAGSCSGGHESDCQIGYCEDSGAICTTSNDCVTGSCVVGLCYDIAADLCTSDTDCSTGICLSGNCAEETGTCAMDYSCTASGSTCIPAPSSAMGSCYRDKCVVTIQGTTFTDESAESSSCRAFPEVDSPFPNQIVKTWVEVDDSLETPGLTDPSAEIPGRFGSMAYSFASGFEQATYCTAGEDCECSYKKISSALGQSVYLDPESDVDRTLGICSGGTLNGTFCQSNEDCFNTEDGASPSANAGTCQTITREDLMVGLNGYCLERDTAINLYGDANTGACLSWLPIDQLKGDTDLYAKYVEAGLFDDTYFCASTEPVMDLGVTDGVACAELVGGSSSSNCGKNQDEMYNCADTVVCPNGYYAILGMCSYSGTSGVSDNTAAGFCVQGFGADNDCPYICVPEAATHENGTLCSPPGDAFDVDDAIGAYIPDEIDPGFDVDVYLWSAVDDDPTNADYEAFDTLLATYADCTLRGVKVTDDMFTVLNFPCSDGSATDCNDSSDSGYRELHLSFEPYPACTTVAKVASTEDGSYAWTDRLLQSSTSYSISDAAYPNMEYERNTTPVPYGMSVLDPSILEDGSSPIQVATCMDVTLRNPLATDGFDGCGAGEGWLGFDSTLTYTNPAAPGARSFIDFIFNVTGVDGETPPSSSGWSVDPATDSIGAILDRVNQIFAYIGFSRLYKWTGDYLTGYSYDEQAPYSAEVAGYSQDVRETEGNPPMVWAVETDNCYGSLCREGEENAITLNDVHEGDQSAENGFFRANVKFYAAADKNQLPIRRVLVDWGDGADEMTGSIEADNYYKNHRGLIVDSQSETYCDTGDEWGMTADSCDENYFNYTHNYRCSNAIMANLDSCEYGTDGRIKNSPCTDGNACMYQPRVHIRDNWGWCSGTCDEGCFTNEQISTTAGSNECSYLMYPRSATDDTDPWVYYDGIVTVTP
ncbi:MAG: hypothetical protein WC730_01580 [Patescibacteria group bacterium]|jgi:hypothetical protein